MVVPRCTSFDIKSRLVKSVVSISSLPFLISFFQVAGAKFLFGQERDRIAETFSLKFFQYMVNPFRSELALHLRNCIVELDEEKLNAMFNLKIVKQEFAIRRAKVDKLKEKGGKKKRKKKNYLLEQFPIFLH